MINNVKNPFFKTHMQSNSVLSWVYIPISRAMLYCPLMDFLTTTNQSVDKNKMVKKLYFISDMKFPKDKT